jgi:hypothetical protein
MPPTTTSPLYVAATDGMQSGIPWTKLVVPSTGFTIQSHQSEEDSLAASDAAALASLARRNILFPKEVVIGKGGQDCFLNCLFAEWVNKREQALTVDRAFGNFGSSNITNKHLQPLAMHQWFLKESHLALYHRSVQNSQSPMTW